MAGKYILDYAEYTSLARRAAAEGCVLLKNDKETLPLKEGMKISVFGRIQFDYYKSGMGSGGLVNTRYVVGILDALKEENITLNETLIEEYQYWLNDHPFDPGAGWAREPWGQEEMELSDEQVQRAAQNSDAAIIIIGRTAGEDRDTTAEEGSFMLSQTEEAMIAKVSKAFDKTIVLLNVGNIIDMKWVIKYHPSAVMYVWQGGQEGGHGVTDVLMGRVAPCGKLTDTIAMDIKDYPSTKNFGDANRNIYEEDIFVGYRYFETFAKDKVLFPFGYGLSYSKFNFKNISCNREADKITLKVTVENTGDCAGKEVVQVYVKPPQGVLGKAVRNLVGFAKTKLLDPGEEQTFSLNINNYSFASYDDSGITGYKSCYVLEAGIYEFHLGTDVRCAEKVFSITLQETVVLEQCHEAAAPVESFLRMCAKEDAEGNIIPSLGNTPYKTVTMKEKMQKETFSEAVFTGDMGYKLADVYNGDITLDIFLRQLSTESLCHIVKGEGMCSFKVTPGTAAAFGGLTEELKYFGVPCGCCADGPSGVRMDCGALAFSLPNGACLASTYDEALQEELFAMLGIELRKNHVDTLLGPGMNIHRNPLNGRNFEYFSEDPFLTGKIAAAQLKGMHKYGVTGTIKHFAANNQEYRRNFCDSVVSERALREIYLKGFEIAVKEAGAYSIMTTYGGVNGVWTAGNYDLLTIILRNEWGFDGMVMTDWYADINDEDSIPSRDNQAAMVRAQNDIYMITSDTTNYSDNLAASLEDGTLNREKLIRCAKNILNMLMKTPAMESQVGIEPPVEEIFDTQAQKYVEEAINITYYELEDALTILCQNICTNKGSSVVYGLDFKHLGHYHMRLKIRTEAEELAQIPVSVFMNGILLETISIGNTNGQWVEVSPTMREVTYSNNLIRLYFAQSGMEIGSIEIQRVLGE